MTLIRKGSLIKILKKHYTPSKAGSVNHSNILGGIQEFREMSLKIPTETLHCSSFPSLLRSRHLKCVNLLKTPVATCPAVWDGTNVASCSGFLSLFHQQAGKGFPFLGAACITACLLIEKARSV